MRIRSNRWHHVNITRKDETIICYIRCLHDTRAQAAIDHVLNFIDGVRGKPMDEWFRGYVDEIKITIPQVPRA